MSSFTVTIALEWTVLGQIGIDHEGRLTFPIAPAVPGIYRLRFSTPGYDRLYIGEASDLRRRFRNYRGPGPTQKTSKRINAALLECGRKGGRLFVDIAIAGVEIQIGGQPHQVQLSDKATRRMVEHAAILAHRAEDIESMNL